MNQFHSGILFVTIFSFKFVFEKYVLRRKDNKQGIHYNFMKYLK